MDPNETEKIQAIEDSRHLIKTGRAPPNFDPASLNWYLANIFLFRFLDKGEVCFFVASVLWILALFDADFVGILTF